MAPFLSEAITTDEQREAFETIIRYLDGVSIAVPSDVQQYLDEIRENADAAVTQSASSALAAAMADPEKYIHDNKEMLEQYRAVAESEEYKASPAYRLQEYLKQFQRESGYNDVFIPAMQRLRHLGRIARPIEGCGYRLVVVIRTTCADGAQRGDQEDDGRENSDQPPADPFAKLLVGKGCRRGFGEHACGYCHQRPPAVPNSFSL